MKKQTHKKRSSRKILDAFQIAERQENGYDSGEASGEEREVLDGVLDARPFLKEGDAAGDAFDDEELDSDEALGSDDDYDVLNSRFSQTIRDKRKSAKERERKLRRGEEVLSEDDDDEGYHSVDESQFVTLSEAWDMDDKDLETSKGKDVVLDDKWESESEESEDSESEEESEESEEESEESEEESDNESDSVNLTNTISSLQAQIKKPSAKKRLVTETTEENEFGVPASSQKLSLAEMMGAVDENVAEDAILLDGNNAALPVPEPRIIRERNDRRAAYELAKEDVNKWRDVVRENREADVLQFPMNEAPKPDTSTNAFKPAAPSGDLELRVNAVLTQSALADDKKEATFEEIAVAKLSPEEMRKRTRELRMMRELMFRDDMRAKRIKKIKSKQYHKVHKRERLRNAELVEESDDDDEDHDAKRAEERMSLKHKTQSKWAKSMIRSGLSKDADNRAELEEMLREGERLRARQLGHGEGERLDDDVSDIEREYREDDAEADEEKRTTLGKGVLAMDFMRKAEEKRRQQNLRELELMKEDDVEAVVGDNSAVNVKVNQGRRVYAPTAAASKAEMDEVDANIMDELGDDEMKNLDTRLGGSRTENTRSEVHEVEEKDEESSSEEESNLESEDAESANPWVGQTAPKKSQKVDMTKLKFTKAAARMARPRDDDAIIDLQQTLEVGGDDGEFEQKELIQEAFAGDNVVSEFRAEKKRVAEDEDHKEEDATLPGWGSWGGEDVPARKRRFVRKVEGVVLQDRRRDKKLKNVIINERVNKKNLKYQSSAVPFPFESREQYERSLRMPIGQEWTSRATHADMTTPRVNIKQGVVIDPLKAPFK